MANINFYLRDGKAKQETPIILFLSANKKRYKIATGNKIDPKYWNHRKQRAKSSYTNNLFLNNALKKLADQVLGIYLDGKAQEVSITSTYIKEKLKEINEEDTTKELSFLEVLDQFIEENKSTKSSNTIQTYNTLRYHLRAFKTASKYKLSFDSINNSFKDKFHRFLITTQKLNDTSVQKNFAVLKRFMGYATENGFNQSIDYQHFKFKAAPSTKIHLTEEELTLIEELDLSNSPRLERVRDMFLFGCETSLRHSDIENVKPGNIKITEIDGEEVIYLDLIGQKTRGEIQAPLSQKAVQLIEKYKNENRSTCFPVISNQKFNTYIKEVGQLAKIDTPVQVVKFAANQRIEEEVPKYQLIGSHTARRTFVTLFFERGGSVPACMVYTGHKNYKELETYRKKTLQHKLKIAKDPFQPRFKRVV